jgi:hypothetical protein
VTAHLKPLSALPAAIANSADGANYAATIECTCNRAAVGIISRYWRNGQPDDAGRQPDAALRQEDGLNILQSTVALILGYLVRNETGCKTDSFSQRRNHSVSIPIA